MNNININTKIIYTDNRELINDNEVNSKPATTQIYNLGFDTFSIIDEINSILKTEIKIDNIIDQILRKMKAVINFEGYSITIYSENKIILEWFYNFEDSLRNYLIDSGVIKLAIEEKKSLIIASLEDSVENIANNLLIIPVLGTNNEYAVFIFNVDRERTEGFNRVFSLIELILGYIGQILLRTIFENQLKQMRDTLQKNDIIISKELSYSVVGKICNKSFHNLKNKTQILVSSINLLQKLITQRDEKLDKVFDILNSEIPEFSKTIKTLSEYSKIIINNRKPSYMEFDKLIIDILDFLNLIGLTKDLKIKTNKISQSRIFTNNELLLQAFLLIFIDLSSNGVKEIELDTNEDELRLNVNLKFKTDLLRNDTNNLLEDNTSINFARIKSLLKMSFCNFLTKSSTDVSEIMISIPKRSSQFMMKVNHYAKDFDC